MADRNRTGLFIWEKWERSCYFSAEDFRGIFDLRLTADCRSNGYQGILQEWVALSSIESWGDSVLNPDGSIEGDCKCPFDQFIPLENLVACDMLGRPHYWADGNGYDIDHSDKEMTWKEFREYVNYCLYCL